MINVSRNSFKLTVFAAFVVLVIIILAVLVGNSRAETPDSTVSLALDVSGLEDLGADWAYEGWLIVDGAPVTTGTFTVGEDGTPSVSNFIVDSIDLNDTSAFVLTIEPDPDLDPAPSATHILAGNVENNAATLTVGHPAALGDDFTSATGDYILAAPTSSGADGATHVNGIWWLDPDGGPGASLDLPTLPAGWAYEGWVVGTDGPVSTGTFTDVAAADSDAGGPNAGPNAAPPFPGQDFINPPTDLTSGYVAVISIEPSPDNSPAPFTFKPLVDGDIEDVGGGTLQSMANNAAASFPTGSITIDVIVDVAVGFDFDNLEDLGPGWVYEGWLIDNGSAVTAGRFTVDADGNASIDSFDALVSDVDNIEAYVLTIEPDPDLDPAPSATHVLAGTFDDKVATLTAGHPAALGDDFTSAAGDYILAVPTSSGDDGATHVNGIWWLDPAGGPGASLDLPTLPAGWAYEGWVVGTDGPVSTGTFTDVAAADSDAGGPNAGPNAAPPFPGQDFINPPTDLTSGYAAVISIEPSPDNSPAPFTFKPLVDGEIEDVGGGVLQSMMNNADGSFPTGMATLQGGQEGYQLFMPIVFNE